MKKARQEAPAGARTRPARPAPPAIGRYAAKVFADLARQTRYVDPDLAAEWPRIVGRELALLCRPGRLTGGRIGRTLEILAATGAGATKVQFEAEAIRRRMNEVLGPGVVGRVIVRQTSTLPAGGDGARLKTALSRFRAAIALRNRSD